MASGTLDGSIGKMDGSVRNLILENYTGGALLSRWNTSTPGGYG